MVLITWPISFLPRLAVPIIWTVSCYLVACPLVAMSEAITNLPQYSALGQCAREALSEAVFQISSDCPPAPSDYASCACSKDQNSAIITSSISYGVLEYCASTATDDVTSALGVFGFYCNQGTAPAPTAQPSSPYSMTGLITDYLIYSDLVPCAREALGNALNSLSADCPTAASDYASCACQKDQNSAAVSSQIDWEVSLYCGSRSPEDAVSALLGFSYYCAGSAASAYTTPNPPPGLSGFITDLPAFTGLASCARIAVSSGVMGLTSENCPPSAPWLASCVCLKDQLSASASQQINFLLSLYCPSSATADQSSAQSVLQKYCAPVTGSFSADIAVKASESVPYSRPWRWIANRLPTKAQTAAPGVLAPGSPTPTPTAGTSPYESSISPSTFASQSAILLDLTSSAPGNQNTGTGSTQDSPLDRGSEIGTIIGTILAFIAICITLWLGLRRKRKHAPGAASVTSDDTAVERADAR
jgi:hypothetical protein